MSSWHKSTRGTKAESNTIVPPTTPKKKRNWGFTLNNYNENDAAQLAHHFLEKSCTKYIFQEETGEEGTPHFQGTVCFKNARAFNTMKKINNRAHWFVIDNLLGSLLYCSKEDTRTGKIYSYNVNLEELNEKREGRDKKKPEPEPYESEDIYKNLHKQALDNLYDPKRSEERKSKLYNEMKMLWPNGFFDVSLEGL